MPTTIEAEPVDLVAIARRWKLELELAKNNDKDWIARVKKIVKRYRDDRKGRDGKRKFNILWSNVQTILPAMYAKAPKAEAVRRNKDSDPVGRCAAEILERGLQYEIDQYPDFDEVMNAVVLDRLLGGRGTAWVRFETEEVATVDEDDPARGEQPGEMEQPRKIVERSPVDYVFWEDFRCSPARVWGEVTWVARRVYMSRSEGVKRFGDDFRQVNLSHVPVGLDQLKEQGAMAGVTDAMKKAEVWEIWDKPTKKVIWVADGFDKALDVKDDPYGLDGFWPCPKPLYATQTTDTLEPVPDYTLYQDQAEELDDLTRRIGMLVEALKAAGVYDASQAGVKRLLSEGMENTLIPVDNWAALAEKGGIKGVVDWMPLDQVVTALRECYVSREACKQTIYEITGMSDIMRGSTQAEETAAAQNIKRQFGSLRLRPRQRDVAVFASSLLRIKAQLMADLYSPESLIEMSGMQGTDDASKVPAALQLLKSEPMRTYRVQVASDSLIDMDEEQEKAARVEFLSAAGGFLEKAIPAAQAVPALAPLMGEMLMFGVRAFKAGRPIEAAFDQAVQTLSQPQPPKPNPEMAKIQAQQQQAGMKMQADQQAAQMKMQADSQIAQAKMEAELQVEKLRMQMQAQVDNNRQAAEAQQQALKTQNDAQLAQLEAQMKNLTHSREMAEKNWEAQLAAAVKIQVANIMSQAKVNDAATQTATREVAADVTQ